MDGGIVINSCGPSEARWALSPGEGRREEFHLPGHTRF